MSAQVEAGALRVGGWSLKQVPRGWVAVDGTGLRESPAERIAATIVFGEAPLPTGTSLSSFVEQQIEMLRIIFPGMQVNAPTGTKVNGTEEALQIELRLTTPSGNALVQRQIFARCEEALALLTWTAPAARDTALGEIFQQVAASAAYVPAPAGDHA